MSKQYEYVLLLDNFIKYVNLIGIDLDCSDDCRIELIMDFLKGHSVYNTKFFKGELDNE